jgi:hypothetical protein
VFASTKSAYRHNHVVSSFDPTYSFPVGVGVDPSRNVKDDEWEFGVVSFQPV